MNYLKKLSKSLGQNNSFLTIYKNNSRVIRRKTRGWETKLKEELKDITYEGLIYLETRRGWYIKWFFLLFVLSFSYYPVCYIFRTKKIELLYANDAINQLNEYDMEDVTANRGDEKNANKFLSAYWVNYL